MNTQPFQNFPLSKILFGITLVAALFLSDCQTCDNCEIVPAPKQVTIVNKSNQNLLFGANAVYNPDDVIIKDKFGAEVEFFKNLDNSSLDFSFRVASDSYFIQLDNSDTDTIVFVYGKDKQIECCEEFDVTKGTSVNGKTVANEDAITITK